MTTAEIAAPEVPPEACQRAKYELPGNLETDVYIIPVSGGADSTSLAILLHRMFPEVDFKLVFTDTGAEDPEIYECLDKLEAYIQRPIDRVLPERDMWQLLKDYGNYLPSSQARWCTRLTKAEPFKKWLTQFDGTQKWVFVGIRADESTRVAFTLDEAGTEMPFINLGWRRQDVFQLLKETIGIPRFYSRRSRSGCSFCPFQRRQELVGLLQETPEEFLKGAACEKLSPVDQERHPNVPDFSLESGIAGNWLSLPQPTDDDVIEGRLGQKEQTLFGEVGVFVGAEFFTDAMPGEQPFVWKQRIVSYSNSLSGIKRQLNTRYEHLLSSAEAHDMDDWDIRHKVKFAVYYIEADSALFDPQGTGDGSYTWHSGESYRQIAHVVGWASRVLSAHDVQITAAQLDKSNPLSWLYEQAQSSQKALEQVKSELGRLVAMQWYQAKEPEIDDQLDERFIACAMCSL